MLHRIWQDKHVLPQEIYAMNRSHKNFIFASELLVMEEEERAEKERERQRQKGGK